MELIVIIVISIIIIIIISSIVITFISVINIKQIFPAFLFNIRNYSPDVINYRRREAELNCITEDE